MSLVDIVIIALVGLLAVIGVLKGAHKSLVSLGAFLVSLLLAFFLSKVVAEALLGIDGIRKFVIGTDGWSLYNWIYGGIESVEPTDYLAENFFAPIQSVVESFNGVVLGDITLQQGMALYIAFTLFAVIVGAGIFLVARLLLCIVTMIIKSFIDKRKSGLSRLFGFIIGAVRGFLWSMTITLAFTVMGGLTVLPFVSKVENEYEVSVVAKYVYDWSYAIKNKFYLPDGDMFARLVDKAGLVADEEDEQPNTSLVGLKLDIYCDLNNLNYAEGQPYTVSSSGELEVGTGTLIDASSYSDSGFDAVVSAIMAYNTEAAQKIENGVFDTIADQTTLNVTLNLYKTTIQGDDAHSGSIYDIWTGSLLTLLRNYENKIDEVKATPVSDSQVVIELNRELSELYDDIISDLDDISAKYATLTVLGELGYQKPQLYVVSAAE